MSFLLVLVVLLYIFFTFLMQQIHKHNNIIIVFFITFFIIIFDYKITLELHVMGVLINLIWIDLFSDWVMIIWWL